MASVVAERTYKVNVVTSAKDRSDVKALNARIRSIDVNSERAAKSLKRMGRGINFMSLAAKAYIAIRFANYVTDMSDSMTLLTARIKIVADETVGMTRVMSDLFDVSAQTRSSIDATGGLYQRLALATKTLGTTHEDLLKVTESVASSLLLSGTSAQEAKALMIQLSQAMAKGKLDGDEFRSVMENGAVAADLLAKSLGVTRGQLFALSKAGKITTDVMVKAFVDGVDEMRSKVDEMPITFQAAYTEIENQTKRLVSNLGTQFTWLAEVIKEISEGVAFVADVLEEHSPAEILGKGLRESNQELENLNKGLREAQETYAKIVKTQGIGSPQAQGINENIKAIIIQIRGLKTLGDDASSLRNALQSNTFTPSFLDGDDPEVKTKKQAAATKEIVTWQERYANSLKDSQLEIDRFSEYVSILDNLYFDGVIGLDVYNQELEKLTGTLKENATPAVEKFSEAMQIAIAGSIVDSIGDMTDAIVDFAITGEGSFREMASSILADMSKMILKMVALNALKSAFSGYAGTGGFLGGFADAIVGGKYATGTPYVPSDGLAYLHKGERVVSANQNQVTNNNNYNTTTERPITIANVSDPGQIQDIMSGAAGEEIIINHLRRNPELVRQVLA